MRRGAAWVKRLFLITAVLALAAGLGGCGVKETGAEEEKLKIVCTIFPEYDWVSQLLGEAADQAELTLLLKNGSDLHSYQPTVWDIVKISEADLFVYVGGESDFWVEDVLNNADRTDLVTLNLMEILEDQVQEEEYVEGMQGEPEEEIAYDEHVWLSLRNAQAACNSITKALCELDAEHGELYEQNCAQYTDRLKALDEAYAQAAEQAPVKTLLFGDRFPFRYLTEDYGLDYYAAFSGCSAETEASFHTITFMAEKVEELSLPAVLTIDGSDRKIAQAIVDNTESRSAQVLLLDSMQSVSEADIEAGENYLSIMERNLEVLKTALSENER